MKHFIDIFQETARSRWNSTAVVSPDGRAFTYSELSAAVQRYRILYEDAGVLPGDKIAICADASGCWVAAFIASVLTRAICIPLDPQSPCDELASNLGQCGCKVLVADANVSVRFGCVPRGITILNMHHCLHSVSEFDASHPFGPVPSNLKWTAPNPADICAVCYGGSDAVSLCAEDVSRAVLRMSAVCGIAAGGTLSNALPLWQPSGLVAGALFPLCHGLCVQFGRHTLSGSADVLVTDAPSLDRMACGLRPHQFRVAIAVGSTLGAGAESCLKSRALPFTLAYGLDECGVLVACDAPSVKHRNCTGTVLEGVQTRSLRSGELVVNGINTGDSVRMMRGGRMAVVGKCQSAFSSADGLERIYPESIESLVNEIPAVQESLAVQREGGIAVLVTLRSPADWVDVQMWRTRLNRTLPRGSQINYLEVMETPFVRGDRGLIERSAYA